MLSLEHCSCFDFSCPAHHVSDWQPCMLLVIMVNARSVGVKNMIYVVSNFNSWLSLGKRYIQTVIRDASIKPKS